MNEHDLTKSFGLPESVDPNHIYIYRSGENGVYSYNFLDLAHNYWNYSNAPKDSPDYDPYGGEAILIREQPFPGTDPTFFTPEGRKLSSGVPAGAETLPNESYNKDDPSNIWYGMYMAQDGGRRFVYYDSDIKENLDLWVAYQLRVTDAGIPAYRTYASNLFMSTVVKDRVIGAILMLADQGMYDIEDLLFASVNDIEFIDTTVKLLGRKFVCDPDLLDFLTSLIVDRDIEAPLFVIDTFKGQVPLGVRHISSIFAGLKMSPTFLQYWRANHVFSRIVHRLSLQGVPEEEVLDVAYNELARTFATSDDVRTMIDATIRDTLLRNYSIQSESADEAMRSEESAGEMEEQIEKSITSVNTDDFGVAMIWSDITKRAADEQEFSVYLHSSPLHAIVPGQEDQQPEAETEDTTNVDEGASENAIV